MATTDNRRLPERMRSLLSRLRRDIRLYVVVEGLALALAWLALTYWIALAIDYLPVMMGASEMPRAARAILLLLIVAGLLLILYRSILRRLFVPLTDSSMALLIERRHRDLQDGLITAVELTERPADPHDCSPLLLEQTRQLAEQRLQGVRLRDIFNFAPLVSKLAFLATLLGTLAVFVWANPGAADLSWRRLYLLAPHPWPRSARIEMVGIEVERGEPRGSEVAAVTRRGFNAQGEVKVARGSQVKLTVRADAGMPKIPQYCTIYYRTDDQDRSRVNMDREGGIARQDYQQYGYSGRPFAGILSSVHFDVVGFDHRIGPFHVLVVDSPAVIRTTLACRFPRYMVNEKLSLWLPREIPYNPGLRLPAGSQLTLLAEANKPLVQVEIAQAESGTAETVRLSGNVSTTRSFRYEIPQLLTQVQLDLQLLDTDGITSERPQKILIEAIEDQPPKVDATLRGIGPLVTPDVMIPVQGKIVDDYGVARCWVELRIGDGDPREIDVTLGREDAVDTRVDFRELRSQAHGVVLQPQTQLDVAVKAADSCDLRGAPNVGQGDLFRLEVVTPEELLSSLERRELGLRQRLEIILDEVMRLRDELSRVAEEETAAPPGPATSTSLAADAAAAPEAVESLSLLLTQRGLLQSQKSAQEVDGVASSFDDICEELTNNRLDTQDRRERLTNQIAEPLHAVATTRFPELESVLQALEAGLIARGDTGQSAADAVQQVDDIIIELTKILQKMEDLETFNELVDMLRKILSRQEELADETKKRQKSSLLEELLK